MRLRPLGKRPIQAAELCLGGMLFSNQSDLAVARCITDHAREQVVNVNFIDTANVCSTGSSELTGGELLKGTRQDRVPATQVGNKMAAASGTRKRPADNVRSQPQAGAGDWQH